MMDDAIREEEESLFMEGEREFLSKRAALHCVVCMPFPVWSRHVLLAITYLQRKRGEEEEGGGERAVTVCMSLTLFIYLLGKVERKPQLHLRTYSRSEVFFFLSLQDIEEGGRLWCWLGDDECDEMVLYLGIEISHSLVYFSVLGVARVTGYSME